MPCHPMDHRPPTIRQARSEGSIVEAWQILGLAITSRETECAQMSSLLVLVTVCSRLRAL